MQPFQTSQSEADQSGCPVWGGRAGRQRQAQATLPGQEDTLEEHRMNVTFIYMSTTFIVLCHYPHQFKLYIYAYFIIFVCW